MWGQTLKVDTCGVKHSRWTHMGWASEMLACCRSFWEVPLRLRLIRPSILLVRAVMPFM